MSKGDKQRPMNVTYKEYVNKWEKIFGETKNETDLGPSPEDIEILEDETLAKAGYYDELKSKNNIELLNDRSLEFELERMKTGHA